MFEPTQPRKERTSAIWRSCSWARVNLDYCLQDVSCDYLSCQPSGNVLHCNTGDPRFDFRFYFSTSGEWRCQICLKIVIKTTFSLPTTLSAHSAFKDQCTPVWGQIGRGTRKRPDRMRNTLLITIQNQPVTGGKRKAQGNQNSSQLISGRALPCATKSWGNPCWKPSW